MARWALGRCKGDDKTLGNNCQKVFSSPPVVVDAVIVIVVEVVSGCDFKNIIYGPIAAGSARPSIRWLKWQDICSFLRSRSTYGRTFSPHACV